MLTKSQARPELAGVFEIMLRPWSSMAELGEEFRRAGIDVGPRAWRIIQQIEMVRVPTLIQAVIITPDELGLTLNGQPPRRRESDGQWEWMPSHPMMLQCLPDLGLLSSPPQAGVEFFFAKREHPPGEKVTVGMEPIEGNQVGHFKEVLVMGREQHRQPRITTDGAGANVLVGFDRKYLVQVAP
ncbi:MAG: hypothetical protein UW86_C0024G0012 [Microgenomates group bacterium GW2011_GWA1_Microgenomates_45_10]|uniref:Uncharacterized protein n=1 Tax=Candidatus Yanofskybacteria bacterium RIFCSPHIGHO2_01_FULL_48_25b TaxID=1802672 RepID=A0A1F8F3C6_9BACT|nr:MAG: hypothetical protein UW86_C0024G0012 [Microgenomates group bacterium GW2011_GWA1_Microgenomates_45_10]OGN06769.1 MAG: hypothetical protein A2669_00360 [Candidatus Yanofskybacteria bacterium RIFCSPHIGHO2_01_FULL_48_25b]